MMALQTRNIITISFFVLVFSLIINSVVSIPSVSGSIWEVASSKVCGNRLCSEIELDSQKVTEPRTLLYPKDQAKKGIPIERIICLEGLHLMMKNSDGSPACVTEATLLHLIERGWGIKMNS